MINPGVVALLAGLAAQAAKVVVEAALRRRWRPGLFLSQRRHAQLPHGHGHGPDPAGGPGRRLELALASLVIVFSFFVMFEATGLRQEIGQQAQVLNELMDRALAGDPPDRRAPAGTGGAHLGRGRRWRRCSGRPSRSCGCRPQDRHSQSL